MLFGAADMFVHVSDAVLAALFSHVAAVLADTV